MIDGGLQALLRDMSSFGSHFCASARAFGLGLRPPQSPRGSSTAPVSGSTAVPGAMRAISVLSAATLFDCIQKPERSGCAPGFFAGLSAATARPATSDITSAEQRNRKPRAGGTARPTGRCAIRPYTWVMTSVLRSHRLADRFAVGALRGPQARVVRVVAARPALDGDPFARHEAVRRAAAPAQD